MASSGEKKARGSDLDGGGTGHSVGNNVPLPMSRAQGYRKVDRHTVVAAGTTFIGPANTTSSNNVWYQFPWHSIYPFMNQDQTMEIISKYKYWKFARIEVEIKNPMCIQELQAANGTTQSGGNMSANLYGYRDDEYLTNIGWADIPHNSSATSTQRQELYNSWHHNGLLDGTPRKLFSTEDIPMEQFCTNHPDVTQCGMGNAEGMSFGWNDHCPYWRATQEFMMNGSMRTSASAFDQYPFCMGRWDTMMGTIGKNWLSNQGDNSQIGATMFTNWEQNNQENAKMGPFSRQGTPNGLYWHPFYRDSKDFAGATISRFNIYKSPTPMPNLFFTLQPQLGSITAGAGDSVCQVQYEVRIHLDLSGRIPRQLRVINAGTNWSEPDFTHGKGRQSSQIPLFEPIWLSQMDRPVPNIPRPSPSNDTPKGN